MYVLVAFLFGAFVALVAVGIAEEMEAKEKMDVGFLEQFLGVLILPKSIGRVLYRLSRDSET